jgi:hypothetical protein
MSAVSCDVHSSSLLSAHVNFTIYTQLCVTHTTVAYSFVVYALNERGRGAPADSLIQLGSDNAGVDGGVSGGVSDVSGGGRVVLAEPPSAPLTVAVGAGRGPAARWVAPTLIDGEAGASTLVTSFTVTSNPGSLTAVGAASPLQIYGLQNGVAYTFTVVAANAAGVSPASLPSAPATPTSVPGAPTIATVTTGDGVATVVFEPPTNNGGLFVVSYDVIVQVVRDVANNSDTLGSFAGHVPVRVSSSPGVVTGLQNGLSYSFSVAAVNALGVGAASAASPFYTPATTPDAPRNVVGEWADSSAIGKI